MWCLSLVGQITQPDVSTQVAHRPVRFDPTRKLCCTSNPKSDADERRTETWWRFSVAQALTTQADAETLPLFPSCSALALDRGSTEKASIRLR